MCTCEYYVIEIKKEIQPLLVRNNVFI